MPIRDVKIGKGTKIAYPDLINLYECELGKNVFIGPFCEIGGAKIGDRTRIGSHSYICPGVEIGKDCLIAHGVMFINDKFTEEHQDWVCRKTIVGNNVRIGSNATILPIKIGNNVIIGAGAVVTKDVPSNTVAIGNPAHIIKRSG